MSTDFIIEAQYYFQAGMTFFVFIGLIYWARSSYFKLEPEREIKADLSEYEGKN